MLYFFDYKQRIQGVFAMGKITEENRRTLENAVNYDDATLT